MNGSSTVPLYAWARPLDIDPKLDHTWVTNYSPVSRYPAIGDLPPGACYWYCWGDFHADGRAIGTAQGNIAVSSCICAPNDKNAHGTIFIYGVDGVFHQLANQVLYSTGASSPSGPLTVQEAHGYWLSSFLYGTYGSNVRNWTDRVQHCAKPTAARVEAAEAPRSHLEGRMHEDFEKRLTEAAAVAPDAPQREQLRALREQFRTAVTDHRARLLAAAPQAPVSAQEVAAQLNERINQSLAQAATILRPEAYEKVFGVKAGQPVTLVDPAMVELSLRQQGK